MRFIILIASCSFLLAPHSAASSPKGGPETWLSDATDRVLEVYDGQSLLIIGELHGNRETPRLVASLLARLAAEGPVTIALEIPRQEQQRIDSFLGSDGSRRAVANLLAGDFWQIPEDESDGRRSMAMLALLDAVREVRSQSGRVYAVTVDDVDFYSEGSDRRQGMADRIGDLGSALDKGPVLVLLGNFHARVTAFTGMLLSDGMPVEPPRPTASLVIDVPLTSLNVTACGGASWSCRDGTCGPTTLPVQCESLSSAELSELDPKRDGYHYSLTLPKLTPSAPAR